MVRITSIRTVIRQVKNIGIATVIKTSRKAELYAREQTPNCATLMKLSGTKYF